jgi:hypothetical protein
MPLFMRVLVLLLVFAIGFGGYSTAAHAAAQQGCGSLVVSKSLDSGNDDCSDYQSSRQNKDAHKKAADDSGVCLDCLHCCTSHVMNTGYYSLTLPLQIGSLFPVFRGMPIGAHQFSFLRPPQSIV